MPDHSDPTPVEDVEVSDLQTDPDVLRREEFMRGLVETTPTAYVAPVLIALNVAVFVAMLANGVSPMNPATDALFRWGANYGPLTTHGQWWRLLTAMFLHGGALHLAMNMLVLLSAGRSTERLFGHLGFAVLYVMAGLAGSLTSLISHPTTASVGASGAIFGLYGGVLGFLLTQRGSIPLDVLGGLLKSGATFVVVNLAFGFTQPHIDMAAHIGGLVAGIPIGCALAVAPGPNLTAARLWRSATVTLAGVALAAAVAARVPIVDDWPAEMARLSVLERESLQRFNALLEQVRSKAMTGEQFAETVETDLLPAWEAERVKIAALRLPEPHRTTSHKLVEFMSLRADAMRLVAEGTQTSDSALLRKGELQQEASLAALESAMPSAAVTSELARLRARRAAVEALEAEVKRVVAAEATALKEFNDLLERLRTRKINRDQFVESVEKHLLPPWTAERDALAQLTPPDAQAARVKTMIDYMSLRGEAWLLAAQAIRNEDAALMRKAALKQTEASKLAKSMAPPAGAGAPRPTP